MLHVTGVQNKVIGETKKLRHSDQITLYYFIIDTL